MSTTSILTPLSDGEIEINITETDFRNEIVCGWIDISFGGVGLTCMIDPDDYESESHAVRTLLTKLRDRITSEIAYMDTLHAARANLALKLEPEDA